MLLSGWMSIPTSVSRSLKPMALTMWRGAELVAPSRPRWNFPNIVGVNCHFSLSLSLSLSFSAIPLQMWPSRRAGTRTLKLIPSYLMSPSLSKAWSLLWTLVSFPRVGKLAHPPPLHECLYVHSYNYEYWVLSSPPCSPQKLFIVSHVHGIRCGFFFCSFLPYSVKSAKAKTSYKTNYVSAEAEVDILMTGPTFKGSTVLQ